VSLPSAERCDALLAAVLPAESLHAVGGRVRDEIRSGLDGIERAPKDLDYVVIGVELADLVERLRRVGGAEVVGAFAVVKCTIEGRTVDLTLPRRERSTGARHRDFAVEFGPQIPLDEDLGRRDFRMNMIARRIDDRRLVDPYGGVADIEARRVDLLREAAFEEDPLRMLRAAQFAARFGYALTERTLAAMQRAAPLVATVSAERTRDELVKLLVQAERPSLGIELLRGGGVLAFVLPELLEGYGIEQNAYHAYDVYGHGLATVDAAPPGDLVDRLAALLHDIGKPRVKDGPHFYRHEEVGAEMVRAMLQRLRFSGEVVERVERLVAHHMYTNEAQQTDAAILRFIRRIGEDLLPRQFALRAADIAGSGLPKRGDANERFEARVFARMATAPPLGVAHLAVDGRDAIAALDRAAHRADPAARPSGRGSRLVGLLLHDVLELVTEEPSANERDRLLGELERLAASRIAENHGDRVSEGVATDGGR